MLGYGGLVVFFRISSSVVQNHLPSGRLSHWNTEMAILQLLSVFDMRIEGWNGRVYVRKLPSFVPGAR